MNSPPPDAARLRAFAERYTAAWCSQNAASVAECYASTGSLRVNDAAPAVGRAAITGVAQGFMTAFPDMRVIMDDLLRRDDGVEYHWTLTGTNTGPAALAIASASAGSRSGRWARTALSLRR